MRFFRKSNKKKKLCEINKKPELDHLSCRKAESRKMKAEGDILSSNITVLARQITEALHKL